MMLFSAAVTFVSSLKCGLRFG